MRFASRWVSFPFSKLDQRPNLFFLQAYYPSEQECIADFKSRFVSSAGTLPVAVESNPSVLLSGGQLFDLSSTGKKIISAGGGLSSTAQIRYMTDTPSVAIDPITVSYQVSVTPINSVSGQDNSIADVYASSLPSVAQQQAQLQQIYQAVSFHA